MLKGWWTAETENRKKLMFRVKTLPLSMKHSNFSFDIFSTFKNFTSCFTQYMEHSDSIFIYNRLPDAILNVSRTRIWFSPDLFGMFHLTAWRRFTTDEKYLLSLSWRFATHTFSLIQIADRSHFIGFLVARKYLPFCSGAPGGGTTGA